MNADEPVGQLLRQINLVQRENDRHLLFAHQLLEHGQQFQLVANVEEGGGFIEHNDLRLLADGAGQQHTLPLSIADAGKIAVGKFIRADKRQRLVHLGAVLVAEQTKPSGVRIAACSRHIPAGHQLRPHMLGEQHGHRARKVTFRQSLQRFAIQIYRTADERQLTDEAFEDGRFTRAVRTDER